MYSELDQVIQAVLQNPDSVNVNNLLISANNKLEGYLNKL
jgi:hypothetical protein